MSFVRVKGYGVPLPIYLCSIGYWDYLHFGCWQSSSSDADNAVVSVKEGALRLLPKE